VQRFENALFLCAKGDTFEVIIVLLRRRVSPLAFEVVLLSVFFGEKMNHNVFVVNKKPSVSQNSLPIVILSSINPKFFGLVGHLQLLKSFQEIVSNSVVVSDGVGRADNPKSRDITPSEFLQVDVHEVLDLFQLKS